MAKRGVHIGPGLVEQYPLSAWSKSEVDMIALWQIVGPTVEKHIGRLPIWQVFCACYFEGLVHGVEGVAEMPVAAKQRS